MEQAILALLGVNITLMLYLDRGRRADIAQLRQETQAALARLEDKLETKIDNGLSQLESKMSQLESKMDTKLEQLETKMSQLESKMDTKLKQLETKMDTGFNRVNARIDYLTEVVMDLARRVGRLEGRAEADTASTQYTE
ncbi:MAG: hypothetical protein OXE93_05350 [bacterium]|nr:hypothetical protein [bacterium]